MPNRTDTIRAAIVLVLNNLLNVAVLLSFVNWDAEQVAGVNAFLTSTVTLAFLLIPSNPAQNVPPTDGGEIP